MAIKPYLYQGLGTALLATMVNSLGVLGSRVVSRTPVAFSGALAAGVTAGISAAGWFVALEKTSLKTSIQGYFPESKLNFEMFSLMVGTFFSSLICNSIASYTVFKRPISLMGLSGYSFAGAASSNIVALYILDIKKKD